MCLAKNSRVSVTAFVTSLAMAGSLMSAIEAAFNCPVGTGGMVGCKGYLDR